MVPVVRLLAISDIHGHADALAAVLAAADRVGYDRILAAGDHCFPGPAPLEVWRRLKRAGALMVQGVGDRAVAAIDPDLLRPKSAEEVERRDRLRFVRSELGPGVLAELGALPPTTRLPLPDGGELCLVHGSPADPLEPMTHEMTDDELRALLGDDPADIVVCGGSHLPFDREVMGVRIINVGSVGEPVTRGIANAVLLDWTGGRFDALPMSVALGAPAVAQDLG
jgi:predicted phosphodiesterase